MRFETPAGPRDIEIAQLIVAGWTGRDAAAVDDHIAELAALGVAPPSTVPLYYRVARSLLTQCGQIEVVGHTSSGEVEPLLLQDRGDLFLGLASDHTDRELETVSVAASKQVCAKPVSSTLWPLSEIEDHLDQLVLRCDIDEGGRRVRYQEGRLAAIRPMRALAKQAPLVDGCAMLCGTLAALGGVRPATRYAMELSDPVLNRAMHLTYAVTSLPVIA